MSKTLSLLSLLAVSIFLPAAIARSQDNQAQENLTELVDQVVDVRLTKNVQYSNFTVVQAAEGSEPGSIKNLKLRFPDSKKTRGVSVSKVVEIFIDGQPLDVEYNRKGRYLAYSEEKRAARLEKEQEINAALRRSRDRLWPRLTKAQHAEYMEQHNDFLEKTKTALPTVEFRYVETDYFMFLTNLAPREVDGLIVHLDNMYSELCEAFGIPPTQNVWCGKCVVVCFRQQAEYMSFERTMMKFDATGTQGLCHSYSDGRVIFSGYQGDGGLPNVLVHETSHGFIHRYMSSARIPSWLNEGMADWIADAIVKSDRVPKKQQAAAMAIQQRGTIGNFFQMDPIGGLEYGIASSMVQLLLKEDGGDGKFKEFFDGIKMGKDTEQSLKDTFKLSYKELTIMYARAIGMGQLR